MKASKMINNTTVDEERGNLRPLCRPESQTETLPKNAFSSRFTWICYELPNLKLFRVWVSLWVLPVLWWKYFIFSYLLFWFIFCMLLILVFMKHFPFIGVKSIISKELDKFSREVIVEAPGADEEDWESVASHFNSYLYERKLWNTKYCIYDGASCYEMFRVHLLDLFTLAHDNPEKLRVLKESIPCGEEALEVYRKQIDKRWKFISWEKVVIDLENIKLPRETCYSKLSWGLKSVFKGPGFISEVLGYLAEISLARNFESPFGRAAYVTGCVAFNTYLLYEGFQNRVLSMKLENKMHFLSVIINTQNSLAENAWDTVAKQMNSYLFEQKAWRSDEFFFDGAECELFFRRHFADVLLKKRSPAGNLNSELWPYIEEALTVCTYDFEA